MVMRRKSFLIAIIFIALFTFMGCRSNEHNIVESKLIKGCIKEMHLSYIFSSEGCRVSTICFLIDIENFSHRTIYVPFNYFQSHCEREIHASNSHWVVSNERIPLAVIFEDSLASIQPNQLCKVKLKAMMVANDKRLTQLKKGLKTWAELPFSISYLLNGEEIVFNKSSDFTFSFSVDDRTGLSAAKKLLSSESLPLPPPIFLDTIEQSTEEPELQIGKSH
jgi:hypothetical protein